VNGVYCFTKRKNYRMFNTKPNVGAWEVIDVDGTDHSKCEESYD
jgi:hypothetical protein